MTDDTTKTPDSVSEQQQVEKETGKDDFEAECDDCRQSFDEVPPIDFTSFVFSISTSTMIFLGVLPDTTTGKQEVDLAMAKQHIDILAMLLEKTVGNLAEEEKRFLESSLYDLRMRFVSVCKPK